MGREKVVFRSAKDRSFAERKTTLRLGRVNYGVGVMSKQTFRSGQLVTFNYGSRSVQGVVKEDRGPIGMKGRVLNLVEFVLWSPHLTSRTLNYLRIESRKWISQE